MVYEKTNWQTGDIITAEKLNHMEDGIAGGTLVIGGFYIDPNGSLLGTSDKTWQEIHDALVVGKTCIVISQNSYDEVNYEVRYSVVNLVGRSDGDGTGILYFISFGGIEAACDSPDGYPTISDEEG